MKYFNKFVCILLVTIILACGKDFPEEKRRLTLGRLGVIYNRAVNIAKNPLVNNIKPGTHELWPIPQSEIERNKDAKLEQNKGY